MSKPPDKKDPTMQFPLAIQVCRRVVTIVEQMLGEGQEVDREQWESLLKSAKTVVNLADRAPADAELVPRMVDTVKVRIEPEDPLGKPKEDKTGKTKTGKTKKIDMSAGRPVEKKPTSRLVLMIAAACLVVLGVEIWMYFDLRGQIERRAEVVQVEPAEPQESPEPAAKAEAPENVEKEPEVQIEKIPDIPAVEPEPTSQKAPEGWGWLDVGMEGSWAFVYIDGQKIRTTPLLSHRLQSGVHKVELRDGAGSLVKRWQVNVNPYDRVKLLHKEITGKKRSKAARGYGYLVAVTKPWSRVFVNDKNTGQVTPVAGLDRLKLRAGEHKVTFVTEKGDRFVYFVTIEAGKEKRLMTTLE